MRKHIGDGHVFGPDLKGVYRTVTRFFLRPVTLLADNPTRSERRWGLQRVRQVKKWYTMPDCDGVLTAVGQYWHTFAWSN